MIEGRDQFKGAPILSARLFFMPLGFMDRLDMHVTIMHYNRDDGASMHATALQITTAID